MPPSKPLGSSVHDFSTESRTQYVLRDPALYPTRPPTSGPSSKPSVTSTMKGHPWVTEAPALPEPAWARPWTKVGMPGAAHFATSAAAIGALHQQANLHFPIMQRAKDAQNVRYLQAPYLPSGAEYFQGKRPTSSSTTHSIFSGTEAALLAGAEQRFADCMNASHAISASRASTASLSAVPNEWVTSSQASYPLRPAADIQQHRLRGFTTAKHLSGAPLNGAPQRCATAPLLGSSVLHTQQFVGMRDPDGSRRLLEVELYGAPAPAPKPKPKGELPEPWQSQPYISSQPATTSNAAARDMDPSFVASFSGLLAASRQPWPKEVNDTTQHRRPFAGDYINGQPDYQDYKIMQTKAQAAKVAASLPH